MYVFVHAGYVAPGLAAVVGAQQAADLDADVHDVGVGRVGRDVLGVGDMRRPREAPRVDRRYLTQRGALGPARAEVIADEKLGRLGTAVQPRGAVALDRFEAVDVLLGQ